MDTSISQSCCCCHQIATLSSTEKCKGKAKGENMTGFLLLRVLDCGSRKEIFAMVAFFSSYFKISYSNAFLHRFRYRLAVAESGIFYHFPC